MAVDNGTCSVDLCDKPLKAVSLRLCAMHAARHYRYGSPTGKPSRPSLSERVMSRIDPRDGCWSWDGYHDHHGYAVIRHKGGNARVHRIAYEALAGQIAPGMFIDHACHNRACVNPSHLRQVTNRENVENFTKPLRSHNTSGYRGVSYHKPSGLWHARVKAGNRVHSLGYYRTAAEAGEVARKARLALHEFNDLDRGAVVRGV